MGDAAADTTITMKLGQFGVLVHAAGATTWDGSWQPVTWGRNAKNSTRTGGPDDDDDDEAALVRKLMPIVAIIIILAAVFGG